jgi:hypothetical protein
VRLDREMGGKNHLSVYPITNFVKPFIEFAEIKIEEKTQDPKTILAP